jgi:hypothetical protein
LARGVSASARSEFARFGLMSSGGPMLPGGVAAASPVEIVAAGVIDWVRTGMGWIVPADASPDAADVAAGAAVGPASSNSVR